MTCVKRHIPGVKLQSALTVPKYGSLAGFAFHPGLHHFTHVMGARYE